MENQVAIIKKHLREFLETDLRSLDYVKNQLETIFGTLYRIGGESRIYEVGDTSEKAAIYAVNETLFAVALAWTTGKVKTIYWWESFKIDEEPDYALEIPEQGNFATMLPTISEMIKNHTIGAVDVDA
jgi:hypothetical protein